MSTLSEEQIKELCLGNLRIIRNIILKSSDKFVTIDYPHASEEKKQEWFAYRKALRDLPTSVVEQNIVLDADLTNVVFPIPPS
tara:strand:+ start:1092 stop:1340 length:249 start_codon:yes stop_codon:yes gene_type:complete